MDNKNIFIGLQNSVRYWTNQIKIFPVILGLIVIIFSCQSSFAQDSSMVMKPTKFKNVTWYGISQVNFKQGKMQDALNIIKKYFIPAIKAAHGSLPVMTLEDYTGKWDMTIIWGIKNGPSDLEWKISPDGAAFREQLVKMLGSKKKVKELWDKYDSYISNSTYNIAMQEDAFKP